MFEICNVINGDNSVFYSLPELPRDFKRVLRVQLKEFIYFLEENGSTPAAVGLKNAEILKHFSST